MAPWQAALQRRFDTLEVLPASFAAAMSVLALARRDDAEIDDYAKIIGSDPALSSKLLAFTNSSWFAIQRRITTVKHAVGMVGVANVRALSVSYALAGLHSALRLNPDDARAYWESTLCKAAAARVLADELLPERADDAYTLALFQDIAVSLFAAVAPNDYPQLYQHRNLPVADQLAAETTLFGADHAAWGARLGEKLK
ncbi:MAG: HDOD domain-containing protein, partial [Phycisphaerae bacterium]